MNTGSRYFRARKSRLHTRIYGSFVVLLIILACVPVIRAITTTPTPTPAVTTLTLNPTDDSMVKKNSPTTNYGTTTPLSSQGNDLRVTYMKFNLSTVAGKTIVSAKLRLKTVVDGGSSVSHIIKQIANTSWTEGTITYNNSYNSTDTTLIPSTVIATISSAQSDTWIEIPVTTLVNQKKGSQFAFAITPGSLTDTDDLKLHSKESAGASPQLVIDYTNPPTPTLTMTPTPASTDGGFTGITLGQTISGTMYITFFSDPNLTSSVKFYIDNTFINEEFAAPYSLGGDTNGVVNGYDTRQLTDGPHTMKATIAFKDGTTQIHQIIFTVNNTAPTTITPTKTPTPTATTVTIPPTKTPTPSAVPSVTTTCQPLSSATNLTPIGSFGIIGSEQLTTFTWAPVPGATSYALRIDDLSDSFDFNYNTGTCSVINPNDVCADGLATNRSQHLLKLGHTYRWWVHAINACGNWSTAASVNLAVGTASPTPSPTCTQPPLAPICSSAGVCVTPTVPPGGFCPIVPTITPIPPISGVPPTIDIVSPTKYATLSGTTVNVVYREAGDTTGLDHVHLQLDDQPEVRDLDNDGKYTFTNVTAGEHMITAYLAHADHSKFPNPEAQYTVRFSTDTPYPTLPANPVNWSSQWSSFGASHFYIKVNNKLYSTRSVQIQVNAVPPDSANPNYTTLEMTWNEGTEMRFFIYFKKDTTNWWVDEMRIYNGQTPGDWIIFKGPYFKTPLNQAFTFSGDYAFGEVAKYIVMENPTLWAFRSDVITGTPCPLKPQGDATCDNKIDLVDFESWREEFTALVATKTADFDNDQKVDLVDFETWRQGFVSGPTSPTPPQSVNNIKRRSDINAILNAISQYQADHTGTVPPGITTSVQDIASSAANICGALVPQYISALPSDPSINNGQSYSSCSFYATGYTVVKNSNNTVTVAAPRAENGEVISVTR